MLVKPINKAESENITVILQGTVFNYDDWKIKLFYNSIAQYKKDNLLIIDFSETFFDKNQLVEELRSIIRQYKNINIIIAIHGSQVFPYGTHYSFVGKNIDLGNYILNEIAIFLKPGAAIASSQILESIGLAAENKPINVWQYTCQGAKLLPYALQYLPKGSKYVAESEAFIDTAPFLYTFSSKLENNQDIDFDKLYEDYLFTMSNINNSFYSRLPYKDCIAKEYCHLAVQDPVKVEIGKKPVKVVNLADKLLTEAQQSTVKKDKLSETMQMLGFNSDAENLIKALHDSNTEDNFSNCLSKMGRKTWTAYMFAIYYMKEEFKNCLESNFLPPLFSEAKENTNIIEKISLIAYHYYEGE